MREMTIVVKNI